MARARVFYSFHYDNDVMRVHQVRNIGVIEGDEPLKLTDWERVWRGGDTAISNWINGQLARADCLVVLIGSDTASRRWVREEIVRAWNAGKGVVGINIHNLNCPNQGTCAKGANPFAAIPIQGTGQTLADHLRVHDPFFIDAYGDIENNIENWVQVAIAEANRRAGRRM